MRSAGLQLGFAILWLLGALSVSGAQLLLRRASTAAPFAADGSATFYVVRSQHYGISLAGAFLVFAGLYFVLGTALRLPLRRWLALTHFGAMLLGATLIFLPMAMLRFAAPPARGEDLVQFLSFCNTIASIGYLLTLVGLAVFVLLLIDAIRRRFRAGHPSPVAP